MASRVEKGELKERRGKVNMGGERCEKKDKIAKRLEKVKGMGNLTMYKKGISVMEFRNQSKIGDRGNTCRNSLRKNGTALIKKFAALLNFRTK